MQLPLNSPHNLHNRLIKAALVVAGGGSTNPVIPPTTEVEDLKALLLSLIQQGAEQKALITAMLSEDEP